MSITGAWRAPKLPERRTHKAATMIEIVFPLLASTRENVFIRSFLKLATQ